jgi:hypothetical protein
LDAKVLSLVDTSQAPAKLVEVLVVEVWVGAGLGGGGCEGLIGTSGGAPALVATSRW